MEPTKNGKKPKNKYNLGDKVRHSNNPYIVYIVEAIFADGSYRIIPINADVSHAITYATEDCMSLYEEIKEVGKASQLTATIPQIREGESLDGWIERIAEPCTKLNKADMKSILMKIMLEAERRQRARDTCFFCFL